MDSVTQFALGSSIGMVCLARRIGPRKAALAGGILGTLPDLDVFIPIADPVDAFVSHRGASHSLVVQAFGSPIIGEVVRWIFHDLRQRRLQTYLAVYLCLATHALLDSMTIYGTRLFWPVWPEPVGLGAIFIIDPIYTVPLVMISLWALFQGIWRPSFQRVLVVCLLLSTSYLVWSATAQQIAQNRARVMLSDAGIQVDRTLTIPTPFNTLFWRVIAISGERYLNIYLPLIGDVQDSAIYVHPSGSEIAACLQGSPAFEKLAAFSDGFYRVDRRENVITISDLRMGLTPNYAFQFSIAEETDNGIHAVSPSRIRGNRREPGDLEWLATGVFGNQMVREIERQAFVHDGLLPETMIASDHSAACDNRHLG